MAKRPVPLYDFKAFGAAIKAARKEYGESRKKVSDELYISPRYLANIENKGQQPSLQVFYDLVTRYHISVDQFFFPNSDAEKSTNRRQLDALLDGMSDKGIRIVPATAREITEVEKRVSTKQNRKKDAMETHCFYGRFSFSAEVFGKSALSSWREYEKMNSKHRERGTLSVFSPPAPCGAAAENCLLGSVPNPLCRGERSAA